MISLGMYGGPLDGCRVQTGEPPPPGYTVVLPVRVRQVYSGAELEALAPDTPDDASAFRYVLFTCDGCGSQAYVFDALLARARL